MKFDRLISAHGTFIGTLRLEPHKPTQLQVNSMFHFGASTRWACVCDFVFVCSFGFNSVHFRFRYYILRERPTAGSRSDNIMEDIPMNDSGEGALLGLPESETDLDVSVIPEALWYMEKSRVINQSFFTYTCRIWPNIIRHIIDAYPC